MVNETKKCLENVSKGKCSNKCKSYAAKKLKKLEENFRLSIITPIQENEKQNIINEIRDIDTINIKCSNKYLPECNTSVICTSNEFAFDSGKLCKCPAKKEIIRKETKEFPFIVAKGTPFEGGKQIAESVKDAILKKYSETQKYYGKKNMQKLSKYARRMIPIIKKYTPTAYNEYMGMASVDGLNKDIIFQLVTNYEFDRSLETVNNFRKSEEEWYEIDKKFKNTDKVQINVACTSFAIRPKNSPNLLIGQTDDGYDPKEKEPATIVNYSGDDNNALIYTHAGFATFFGLNSDGVGITSENLHYDIPCNLKNGVPYIPLVREALTKKTVEDAVKLFEVVPISMPNDFVLAQHGHGIYNIEATPSKTTVIKKPYGTWVHSNHNLLNDDLASKDYNTSEYADSRNRFSMLLSKLHDNATPSEIEQAYLQEPLITNWTVGAAIMNSKEGTMDIFYPYKKQYSINKEKLLNSK